MARHSTRVIELPGQQFAGICSCGWAGRKTGDANIARTETNAHVYDKMSVKTETKEKP